ncbi:MAG TPA: PSP1 C-terminal domain-containing protein [Pirellulaceae bacterium]|nr:PSP1 C-terminal domain-containing protein [Pirellulaceae bacterium]
MFHFVRVGVLGHVGRFRAVESARHPRGTRVVCRTARGLEVGEVLSHAEGFTADVDGTLLRRITVEDDLLLDRLERHRLAAFEACSAKLVERGISAALIDVEHLFDGESLFFYFLGETTPAIDELTAELAEIYDARVQFRKFTETLTAGCGPGCGTAEAAGQGCAEGGCSTCAMAKVCRN